MIPSRTPASPRRSSPPGSRPISRRGFVLGTGLVGLGALAACSSGSDDEANADPSAETTTSAAPVTDERIVVIGEEYLLADLLALGIRPIAATATVAESGFHALDDYDTSEIQALPATERNLELLASLRPDRIIAYQFFADELGEDTLGAMAELTLVADGTGPVDLVTTYGELFGRQEQAAALVTEYEAAQVRAAEALDGLSVSVAAIYAGPSVAAFVDGPWAVPATLLEAGASLVPDAASTEPDRNGRVYLSMERLDLLSAPQMVLMQSSLVEGEDLAVEQVADDPLWTSLPAVAAGEVLELDRLGHPGIEGRIRLIDDLIEGLT
jgi:iron complex transport system substrate-binding protein